MGDSKSNSEHELTMFLLITVTWQLNKSMHWTLVITR